MEDDESLKEKLTAVVTDLSKLTFDAVAKD
jgi:hypothetical protein